MSKLEDDLQGLDMLLAAKNQAGRFVLAELDDEIVRIIAAIRKAPNKGGSLNINMKFEPHSEDGQLIGITAEITGVKLPKIPPKTELAYSTKEGKATHQNPSQKEIFGGEESLKIDKSTGEVIKIVKNQKPKK